VTQRYSRSGAGLACLTLLLGTCAALISAAPLQAAPIAPAKERVAKERVAKAEVAAASDETTASARDSQESAGCQRPRRKLWVDGEGWVIRRVTICH
jgi:hypothetical protein